MVRVQFRAAENWPPAMTGGRLWLALCALLALAATLAWVLPAGALDWQPALAARQPWRWWTAALVHFSPMHLAANLAGLAVVAALGRVAEVPASVGLAWLASWPLTHLALLAVPGLAHYGGLSGVLHGAVAGVATWLVATERGSRRRIGVALGLGLALKIVLERPWGPAVQPLAGWDIAVAPAAHLSGAVSGALCAFCGIRCGPRRALRARARGLGSERK